MTKKPMRDNRDLLPLIAAASLIVCFAYSHYVWYPAFANIRSVFREGAICSPEVAQAYRWSLVLHLLATLPVMVSLQALFHYSLKRRMSPFFDQLSAFSLAASILYAVGLCTKTGTVLYISFAIGAYRLATPMDLLRDVYAWTIILTVGVSAITAGLAELSWRNKAVFSFVLALLAVLAMAGVTTVVKLYFTIGLLLCAFVCLHIHLRTYSEQSGKRAS